MFLYFQIKCSSFFVPTNSIFHFCLVNSEFGACLVVDHGLAYNYSKMFLLFFSLRVRLLQDP